MPTTDAPSLRPTGRSNGVATKTAIRSLVLLLLLLALPLANRSGLLTPSSLAAQEPAAPPTEAAASTAETPAATETPADSSATTSATTPTATPSEPDGATNGWMLVCSALVLFMTAPGLALFYGGLVRRKNVLSVMMQCLYLMGMMTVLWAVIGYSLAFGGSNPYFGDLEYVFLRGVSSTWNAETGSVEVPMYNDALPQLTFMLFQGMFFIITPALICGAFAERMRFSSMVLFSALWGLLVYCPICHWVWDGGILAYGAPAALAGGALDFAGGTVVHISSGVSALLCAVLLGQRAGYGVSAMPPHNLTYTAIGAAMLWVGWFGFNAGSGLAPNGLAASAFAVTHLSAAAGAVAWAKTEWILRGKPTVLGACSGAVAGLVCITPAAGFVNTMPAIAMGAAAGVVCYFACTTLKGKFRYDDSLDAFGVHGVGGILGAILTGVFATRSVQNLADGGGVGLIDGNPTLLIGQTVAVLVTIVYAVVVSLILLKITDSALGLRVEKDIEAQGLDLTQHGEDGYLFL